MKKLPHGPKPGVLRNVLPALLAGTLGVMAHSAVAQDLKFDFGVGTSGDKPASPTEAGFLPVTRQASFDEARGYGWTVRPESDFDFPNAYPPSFLHRDGVGTSRDGAVFVVKLKPGEYDVTAHMGILSATEFRPGMYVKANGETKVRGLMTGGNAQVVRFPTKVTGDRLELEFGAEVFGARRSAALLGLEIRPHTVAATDPGFTVTPRLQWLKTEKIRGLYGSSLMTTVDAVTGRTRAANLDFQADIKRTGMNAFVSNFTGSEGYLDEWIGFAKTQRGKFHIFDLCNLASGPEWDAIQHRVPKVVYANGQVDTKPNPFNWLVWQTVIVDPAIDHIRRARAAGGRVEGMLIDTEMYGAKVAEIFNNGATFDEDTLNEYARDKKLDLTLEAGAAGYKALNERGLVTDYLKWQEDKVTALAAKAAALVRKEDPEFLFGFLQWKENFWFLRGLVRGLGKPGVPTLVFGEDSYWGYNDEGWRQQQVFSAMGANAVYVPGLWPNQLSPRGAQSAATLALHGAGGYWLYGVPVLYAPQNPEDKPEPGRFLTHGYLTRPAAEYWEAFKKANASLKSKGSNLREAWFSEPAQLGPREWVHKTTPLPVPDQHVTSLVKIEKPQRPYRLFDMGIAGSPVAAGFTPVYFNTLFDAKAGYGWLNHVTGSFDRENAEPLDDLTRDGLLVNRDNTFRTTLPNGQYNVTLVLGDMSKNEARGFQNVRVNGQKVLRDVLTNGGEYRVWTFPVTVTDGKIDVLFEAVGDYRDSVMGIMIGQ